MSTESLSYTAHTSDANLSLSRAEHREFAERMDEANSNLDRRMTSVEKSLESLHEMSRSVSELAVSMRTMSEEQHEQHQDIRDIRTTMQSINIDHIDLKLEEHDHRIRVLENTPQDSEAIESRVRAVEEQMHCRAGHEECIKKLEDRVGKMEKEPAENWKKAVWLVIAGVITFVVGIACNHLWPS